MPELRPAGAAEIPALLEVFFQATEDLETRRRQPIRPINPAPLEQHIRHLLDVDPASCIVADDAGRIVAFGMSAVRGSTWFLSFLFVVPGWQAHGLGRAVLQACLDASPPTTLRATCAEADQPVATGLYASLGLAPRVLIFMLRGTLDGEVLPRLPSGVLARPLDPKAVAHFDEAMLGYQRPRDHAFWAQHDRHGWVFEDDLGHMLGYGYAQPTGRVGPVAAADPTLLMPFVGHLVRSTSVIEGWQLIVPGPAIEALQPLLRAGLRIDSTPAVYCSDGTPPDFERYLPGSFALL